VIASLGARIAERIESSSSRLFPSADSRLAVKSFIVKISSFSSLWSRSGLRHQDINEAQTQE
jgi:hypothetical protein